MTAYINKDEFDNQPDLTITIRRSDRSRDQLVYMTDEGPIELKILAKDIPELKDHFSNAFAELVRHLQNGLEYDKLSLILLDENNGLALSGCNAFVCIFGPIGKKYLNRKLASISDTKIPVIIINTDVVQIPWECIFEESPLDIQSGTLSTEEVINKFWGTRFILARRDTPPTKSHLEQNKLQKYASSDSKVTIGVSINDSLESASLERDYFEIVKSDSRRFDVIFFPNGPNSISDFVDFLYRKNLNLLHLACHAKAHPKSPFEAYLELSDELMLLVKHLSTKTDPMSTDLIFLNACETGAGNPLGTIDFVRTFQRQKDVENIIATEGLVESEVAGQISIAFYKHFLNEQDSLGAALHTARGEVLKRKDAMSVVSLFYSLHGNPFFHLKDAD